MGGGAATYGEECGFWSLVDAVGGGRHVGVLGVRHYRGWWCGCLGVLGLASGELVLAGLLLGGLCLVLYLECGFEGRGLHLLYGCWTCVCMSGWLSMMLMMELL